MKIPFVCALAVISALSLGACAQKAAPPDAHPAAKSGAAPVATANPLAGRMDVATSPAVVVVGKPVRLTLRLLDPASGTPLTALTVEHEKTVHLYVISADLSWFNHLHPTGAPESLSVTTVLPSPGAYQVFADYTPQGGTRTVARASLVTGGHGPVATSILPVIDAADSQGWIVHRVQAAPEGRPDAARGSKYAVALMPMPGKLKAGAEAMLHFEVRDAAGRPVSDLQPYLGAMGHAVILSTDAQKLLHVHPMDDGTGKPGAVAFHVTFPAPGPYKLWAQFKHGGLIMTAPFVLSVE